MSNEQIISDFLRTAYTDEKLAALLAHAEDGKLAFVSCCCFAGIPTAVHALQGETRGNLNDMFLAGHERGGDWLWFEMSSAYCRLAREDADRRAKIIPLIHKEMSRRESLRVQTDVFEEVCV